MEVDLSKLNDEEFKFMVRQDISFFLEPIKKNENAYRQYDSVLGNKSAKSKLVQLNLPGVVTKSFRKHDKNFVPLMEVLAEQNASCFMELVEPTLKRNVTVEEIRTFSDAQIVEMLHAFKEGEGNELDYDLLWIQLKLLGVPDVDDRKAIILKMCGEQPDGQEDRSSLNPEKNADTESELNDNIKDSATSKKKKTKKLTAEEKAAKNRAALEAKEKARNESKEEMLIVAEDNPKDEPPREIITEQKKTQNDGIWFEPTEKLKYYNKEDSDMSVYLGVINIKSNYYNFTPIGLLENGEYTSYSEIQLDELLPSSQKHNIVFYYNFYDNNHSKFMADHFYDYQLIVLNSNVEDLELNKMPDGTLNATGYKVPAIDGFRRGTIKYPSDVGLFKLIQRNELVDDIETKKAIRINREDLLENEKVLVNLGEGFFAGPFVVKYAATTDTYYVVMQAEEGKHYIAGYKSTDCNRIFIEPSLDVENWIGSVSWNAYYIKNGSEQIVRDCISDKELLESFKKSLESKPDLDYGNLNVEDILAKLGTSQIVGDNLPEEIKIARISRVREIMSSAEELQKVYSDASDLICELLLNNRESMQTEQLLSEILSKRPELLAKMQGIKAVESRLDVLRQELSQLEDQKAAAEIELQTKREAAEKSREASAFATITGEIKEKQQELDAVLERLNVAQNVSELLGKNEKLKNEIKYYEEHKSRLQNDTKNLEKNFVELVNGYSEKIADITFDGFMSSRMLQAAAKWEKTEEEEVLKRTVDRINNKEAVSLNPEALVEYCVSAIQQRRPGYTKNVIINILTCAMQGFLTVFSGAPGCGKTSICNILADVLGIGDADTVADGNFETSRYIPVSVERGWTSKRDFIGYYNPLTKAFEESNRAVFDGLRMLDSEAKNKYARWPFVILLDEANLSPMEYYWADFMNICDDLGEHSTINLGNNNIFRIPETLHFLATINNDHTTETLSPRLIDRAWIISLPKTTMMNYGEPNNGAQKINVSWPDLKKTFVAANVEKNNFDRETQLIYEGLKDKLELQGIDVSPRVDLAIHNYWTVASKLMEADEYGNQPGIIALDYAVAQKILPKIMGSGDEFEAWLTDLKNYCDGKNLAYSTEIISKIISQGNRQMKYFQFFN